MHPSRGARQVEQERAGSSERVVTDTLDGKCRKPRRDDGRKLPRVLEHLAIVGDKPPISELMECDEKLAILQRGQPWIDSPERDQPDVDESGKRVEDRLWEVLIDR